jgi:hypothetical protein
MCAHHWALLISAFYFCTRYLNITIYIPLTSISAVCSHTRYCPLKGHEWSDPYHPCIPSGNFLFVSGMPSRIMWSTWEPASCLSPGWFVYLHRFFVLLLAACPPSVSRLYAAACSACSSAGPRSAESPHPCSGPQHPVQRCGFSGRATALTRYLRTLQIILVSLDSGYWFV